MNYIKQRDLEFGEKSELEVLPIIKNYFDTELEKTKYKYATFDFVSNKYCIELKSRNNAKDKYDSTIIGYNKIKKCNDKNKTYIFCFKFTDGIFFWKYNDEEFEKFCEINNGGRKDRGYTEYNQYCYIPVNLLKKIE